MSKYTDNTEWLDDILHDFAVAESLSETSLNDKLKRRVINADEYDDRLVENYRTSKAQAKQAILTHIDTACREARELGYKEGWNAYNEAPYNPNKDIGDKK